MSRRYSHASVYKGEMDQRPVPSAQRAGLNHMFVSIRAELAREASRKVAEGRRV